MLYVKSKHLSNYCFYFCPQSKGPPLSSLLSERIALDVRTAGEYEGNKLAGASNIPLANLKSHISTLDKLVICNNLIINLLLLINILVFKAFDTLCDMFICFAKYSQLQFLCVNRMHTLDQNYCRDTKFDPVWKVV